jgi:hypothetical protein
MLKSASLSSVAVSGVSHPFLTLALSRCIPDAGESGKTSLCKRWVEGGFDPGLKFNTVGVDGYVKIVDEPRTG